MSDWQSIETAPKDGRWILVWAPYWIPTTAAWSDIGPIYDAPRGWYAGDGAYIPATHWMPLPDPPAPAGQSKDR